MHIGYIANDICLYIQAELATNDSHQYDIVELVYYIGDS